MPDIEDRSGVRFPQGGGELTYKVNLNGGRPWGDEGSYDLAHPVPALFATTSPWSTQLFSPYTIFREQFSDGAWV